MRELDEAEAWLESAKKTLASDMVERGKYTVAVSQSIHSIIRANDALTVKFLGKQAMRHDEAPRLFLELMRLNKIPANFANLKRTILLAVQIKSKADYRGIEVSKRETEKWIRDAETFLKCAKECLG